jgi:hypothetical protein
VSRLRRAAEDGEVGEDTLRAWISRQRGRERPHKSAKPPPTEVLPPYGHTCQVCGSRVEKGHPIHRVTDGGNGR